MRRVAEADDRPISLAEKSVEKSAERIAEMLNAQDGRRW